MGALTQGLVLEITPHSGWAQAFWDDLVPVKERVVIILYLLTWPMENCRWRVFVLRY